MVNNDRVKLSDLKNPALKMLVMSNVDVIYDRLECDNVETLVLWPRSGTYPITHDLELNENVRKSL